MNNFFYNKNEPSLNLLKLNNKNGWQRICLDFLISLYMCSITEQVCKSLTPRDPSAETDNDFFLFPFKQFLLRISHLIEPLENT